jgi:2-keto-3-deoxy-L-arabinonate dehydratase
MDALASHKPVEEMQVIMNPVEVRRRVSGVVPVIPIPFDAEEDIDETALRRLIDFAVQAGVSAICLPAYGSEFYKLSDVERATVVKIAVEQAAGKLLVIAQSNHGSSKIALSIANANVIAGADLISVAIPRTFALSDDDLLRYLRHVLNGVDVPCLIQDFNPGGATVSVDFVARLQSECPNFRYLKLEEPLAAPKVCAILEATNGNVGVLEGWGGLYMMELIPAGICGVMPGVALADILNRVFDQRKEGKRVEAFELYQTILPQIVFSLQNMETYLYCEKRLLQARGLLSHARCRVTCYTPDPTTLQYVDELNDRILHLIEKFDLPSFVGRDLTRDRSQAVE